MRWLLIILIILIIPYALSLEASIDCPDKAYFEEEFFCSVDVKGIEDIYDVKIYIVAEGRGINRIWDEDNFRRADWYLREIIDEDDLYDFKLIIHREFIGDAKGEFKLRDSRGRITVDEEFEIKIDIKKQEDKKQEREIREREEDDYDEKEYDEKIHEISQDIDVIEIRERRANQTIHISGASEKPLKLDSIEEVKENKIIYKSKNERIKDYMIYGFIFFLICVIGVLLYEKIW